MHDGMRDMRGMRESWLLGLELHRVCFVELSRACGTLWRRGHGFSLGAGRWGFARLFFLRVSVSEQVLSEQVFS